jgi:hypothetical protein
MRRPSGAAPKSQRKADAATVPPPKSKRAKSVDKVNVEKTEPRTSGIRSRKPPAPTKPPASKKKGDSSGASIDEVTADLSRDPRRDRDD